MRKIANVVAVIGLLVFSFTNVAGAYEQEFDSAELMKELEEKLKLSSEKLSELKPLLDEKSRELKTAVDEGVDKGFLQLEELNKKIDAISRNADARLKEFLSSEEYAKLQEYMSRFDRQALEATKERVVHELSSFLELKGEQLEKIRPVLEETVEQLNMAFADLAREGTRSWDEFTERYEQLLKGLREEIEGDLNGDQLDKLDKYREQQLESIKRELIEV